MLCITLTAEALVAAGAAFAQGRPKATGSRSTACRCTSQLHEYPRHGRDRRAAGRDAPRLRAGAPGPRSLLDGRGDRPQAGHRPPGMSSAGRQRVVPA
jgi:hypothetical protein